MILELLAGVGATLILVRGAIFAPVRKVFPPLFGCAQCAGFWVGAVVVGAAATLAGRVHAVDAAFSAFLGGCATSVLSLLADAVLLKLLGDPDEKGGDP